MTTGMKKDPTTGRLAPRRRVHWVWPVVALIIVVLLIIWAFKTSNNSQNNNAPNATSTSVQQGATGQQGAVGGFAEKVVPNPGGQSQNSIGQPTGTSSLNANGTAGNSGGGGAGAGNTGITTATDNMGGGAVQSGKTGK